MGFKASETLLGIETPLIRGFVFLIAGFKASETLLGIETLWLIIYSYLFAAASKPLKPF